MNKHKVSQDFIEKRFDCTNFIQCMQRTHKECPKSKKIDNIWEKEYEIHMKSPQWNVHRFSYMLNVLKMGQMQVCDMFLICRWSSSVGSSIVTDAKRYRVFDPG